jgi:hypothetical protein
VLNPLLIAHGRRLLPPGRECAVGDVVSCEAHASA